MVLQRTVAPLDARRAHIELWQRELEHRDYAARTIALRLTALASFYSYCENENLISRSPMLRVRRPRVERRSPRTSLSRGQLHDLLAAARELGPHAHGILCLLAFNGLRISEATRLDVDALDYDGLFPILHITRKGGRPGVAVLARPTEAAIIACADGRSSGPLFLTRSGTRAGQRSTQRILDRCAHHLRGHRTRITPHVLRHTWTTLAIDAGVPHDQVQHDGGWADPRMLAYYTHNRDNALRSATHSVAAYVLSAS
ncbi:tyrosine-type recombinase/integrase [Dermatobacter hominis]|uniref:tyrosine-type recombinase/integrase n=1 Tax=Dermatobacter hominis TaxID=2884263 RepID=UPI001D11D042|nr:tyrosine-type recombinase/integrase [Dermatobacter hominis]UDY34017.1 tyrosine-type recombinase/integrase [Dermatobacter hominis]